MACFNILALVSNTIIHPPLSVSALLYSFTHAYMTFMHLAAVFIQIDFK